MPVRRALFVCTAAALVLAARAAHAQDAQSAREDTALEVAVNRPDTRVLVDRQFVGYAPWAGRVAAGPHFVRLEHPTFRAWEGSVLIPRGESQQLRAVLRPPPSRAAAYWLLGGAALSALTGTLFGALVLTTRASLDESLALGRLDERDGRVLAGGVYAGVADTFWAAAIGLAAAGLYYTLVNPPPHSMARLVPLRRPRALPAATEGAPAEPPAGDEAP